MLERTIFFYLLRRNFVLFFVVALSFMVVYIVGQIAELSRAGLGSTQGLANMLMISFFRTPIMMQPALPYVIFLSTALSVSRFVRSSELAVLFQLGVHPRRLLSPFAATGLIVGVVYVLAVHPLSGLGYQYAESEVAEARRIIQAEAKTGSPRELVVLDDNQTVYIIVRRVDPGGFELRGLTFFHLDSHHRFLERFEAARLTHTEQGWRVLETDFIPLEDRPLPEVYERAMAQITPEMLRVQLGNRYGYSIYELPEIISFSDLVGAKTQLYGAQFHGLIALPALLAAVAMLSAAFLVRPLPSRKLTRDAMMVMMVSWSVYILSTVADALSVRGVYPSIVLAWSLPFLLVLAGLMVIGFKGARIPKSG